MNVCNNYYDTAFSFGCSNMCFQVDSRHVTIMMPILIPFTGYMKYILRSEYPWLSICTQSVLTRRIGNCTQEDFKPSGHSWASFPSHVKHQRSLPGFVQSFLQQRFPDPTSRSDCNIQVQIRSFPGGLNLSHTLTWWKKNIKALIVTILPKNPMMLY